MVQSKSMKLIVVSMVCYFISSASVFLLPWSSDEKADLTTVGYMVGVLFWGAMLIGIICWVLAYVKCRTWGIYQTVKSSQRPGMISFFRNPQAAVADIVMIVGLILTIVGNFVWVNYLLGIAGLFLFLFCFHLHYVLNGRIYRCLFYGKD